MFDTHPSVDCAVAALVKFAGGHDPGPIALPEPSSKTDADGTRGSIRIVRPGRSGRAAAIGRLPAGRTRIWRPKPFLPSASHRSGLAATQQPRS